MTHALDGLAEALAAPISGDSPAGADVTYEPDFERLRQAVDRLASVGTAVDHESAAGGEGPFAEADGGGHGEVVEGAVAVLSEQSKDLRAAAYLVASLAHTEGAPGVAAGLRGLAAMAQAHWAELYPRRARARRAAFEFLTSRVGTAVGLWERPETGEAEALEQALAALSDLQVLVSSEMGDQAPALSGLRRALSERQRKVPAAAPPPEPAPEPTPSEPASPAEATDGAASDPPAEARPPRPAAAAAPRPSAPAAAGAAPSGDPVRAVVQAALAMREAEPGSAVAVRLLRVARWDALAQAPPVAATASGDEATRVEPPPARRREALVALAASDPATFAEQAEQAFSGAPFHFWLDLQRLSDGALAALGAPFAGARDALRAETARLVGRLPGLLDLRFRDGTPFADPATQAWAQSLAPASAPASGGTSTAEGDGDDPFEPARAAAFAGDLAGALDSLPPPPGGRAGFEHRLRQADLCLDGGRPELALAQLAALRQTADDRRLDAWEPGLAADLYAAWLRAARRAGDDDQADRAQSRLAAVSPARALQSPS